MKTNINDSFDCFMEESTNVNIPLPSLNPNFQTKGRQIEQEILQQQTKPQPQTQISNTRIRQRQEKASNEIRNTIEQFHLLPKNTNHQNELILAQDFQDMSKDQCNVLVFGPTGSGKSSLINTFFQSLHGFIDSTQQSLLQINNQNNLECTKNMTNLVLKQPQDISVQSRKSSISINSSQINIIDTRGQTLFDENELMQLKLQIQGRVRHMSQVRQRDHRSPYLLWEFWRKDSQLFPHEILREKVNFSHIPHSLILVLDGRELFIEGSRKIRFYKEIIQFTSLNGYYHPLLVLTRLDIVENQFQTDQSQNIRSYSLVDERIQNIVSLFNVPRSHVYFIENIHEMMEDRGLIEYQGLKLLQEALEQAQIFAQGQRKPNSNQNCFFP